MKFSFVFIAAAMIMTTLSVDAAPVVPRDFVADSGGWVAQQAPGFYRFRLGDFRLTALSDGTVLRDFSKIMSKPAEIRNAFEASHETLPVALSINCFLIDTGVTNILVDTGTGSLSGSDSGHLMDNLRAAGYAPENIDAILLTHMHGDHAGGLSAGGQRVFPNAVVYVDKHDLDYWLSAGGKANALGGRPPDSRKAAIDQAHQAIDPYIQAGKLRTFDGATQLLPGIRSIPEYGHTPGLTGYMIDSRGQRLLLWGDIVHAAEVQFADPTVSIDYDVNPREAIASRQRIFRDAATQGYLVGGAHLSFPGLGHVRAESVAYSWVPVPYSVILQDGRPAHP